MGKIKVSLFRYLVISLIISVLLSIGVQSIAQRTSEHIQLKYVDLTELYEYQNEYSELFGDVPTIPTVPPSIMTGRDRIINEICDFTLSWSILIFSFAGVFISLTLFYRRRLKIPFKILNEAADKISRQDLNFKINYECNDELGQICAAYEQMRAKLVENNRHMWDMIDEQKQMRSAFSHDLRTPLTVMKGYVEYLLNYYPEGKLAEEKVTEVLKELQNQTERITKFADIMKNINRLEEIYISRSLVDVDTFLKKVTAVIDALSKKYDKDFVVCNEITDRQLNIDLSAFLEIFENLVDNAMRFAQKSVRLEMMCSEDRMTVRVYDDGKGFPPEALKKAFRPYYHGTSSDAEHYGMGLYICKVLCEKQNGFLQIYNLPNGGACAEVQISV